jgi:aspartyl-tRNA(Asn)/glutamyl-tRNA(Gln) amidotransferase subunit A
MYNSFAEVKSALASGVSVCDLVETSISRIHAHAVLNAFLEVFEESAREQARLVDQKIADGTQGRLAGMIIGLKDNLC